ncbi:hypothetical protein BRPE64_ECDS01000 (plasmid) [Caballeronia insecticola]|uniref:Uncharacterized protein n=1 Tax=Caballeronia insecticola TaxID=758793 RepID=A0A060PGR8_9BURK|nr:hypothetical protein BRPE64_ECDS01000 [Caballeronia insecticola]
MRECALIGWRQERELPKTWQLRHLAARNASGAWLNDFKGKGIAVLAPDVQQRRRSSRHEGAAFHP